MTVCGILWLDKYALLPHKMTHLPTYMRSDAQEHMWPP